MTYEPTAIASSSPCVSRAGSPFRNYSWLKRDRVSENIVVVGLVSEIAATDDDDDGHLLWLSSASSEAEKVMERRCSHQSLNIYRRGISHSDSLLFLLFSNGLTLT